MISPFHTHRCLSVCLSVCRVLKNDTLYVNLSKEINSIFSDTMRWWGQLLNFITASLTLETILTETTQVNSDYKLSLSSMHITYSVIVSWSWWYSTCSVSCTCRIQRWNIQKVAGQLYIDMWGSCMTLHINISKTTLLIKLNTFNVGTFTPHVETLHVKLKCNLFCCRYQLHFIYGFCDESVSHQAKLNLHKNILASTVSYTHWNTLCLMGLLITYELVKKTSLLHHSTLIPCLNKTL